MRAQIGIQMRDLKQFNIPFVGLKEGSHKFEYQINKTFFEAFQYDEFNDSDINVSIDFEKKSTLMKLKLNMEGTVNVPCDVTSESFDQPIDGTLSLIVKFGPEFNDDGEEIIVLPYEEFQINVAQHIYELIVLSVPTKRIHPKVVDGTMESEALKKLKELEYNDDKSVEETEDTDPRWDKLKNLITGKNT